MIPYGKQFIGDEDIQAVVEVLHSDWLTTGPKVEEFEKAITGYTGSQYAVAVSNGTAALHCAMYAIGIKPGDEVIVPAMTFAATANCVVFQGGTPVFVDVLPDTLLIDPAEVEAKISARTKAVIAVDYAGQPCDYDSLRVIADKHKLTLVADACHALGAKYKERPVGSLADLNVFSFHPVKHITTGEGGLISTNNESYAQRMRIFRSHGITTDHRQREVQGSWFYEMIDLGYNYRITDFQCALGISQLRKLRKWIDRRQIIAHRYDEAFQKMAGIEPLGKIDHISHAYHLYIIRIGEEVLKMKRQDIFTRLRGAGIGVNVHYIPVHLHPFYKNNFHTGLGLCPNAEAAHEQIISMPMYPALSNEEQDHVIDCLRKIVS